MHITIYFLDPIHRLFLFVPRSLKMIYEKMLLVSGEILFKHVPIGREPKVEPAREIYNAPTNFEKTICEALLELL